MVNYKCLRCGYETHIKTILIRHLNRKNICRLNNIDIKIVEYKEHILSGKSYEEFESQQKNNNFVQISQQKNNNKTTKGNFKCIHCNKVLSYKQSYYKHLQICKEKKKEEEAKDSMDELVKILNNQMKEQKKELDKRDKQIKEQNKQIEQLIKKAGINNSNITQNIQNNIKLLAYKDTDISTITNKDIRSCMNHNNMCVSHLIKMIHLDPKKPENHNVYISNLKNGYIMVYDGDKWDTLNREEIIEDMINNKECLIQDRVEDWLENGKNYPIIMRKFERYLEKKEKDVVLNKIKEEIRLMLFNNRNMINKNPSKLLLETEEKYNLE